MGRRLTIRRPATRVTAGPPPSCLTYRADPFCSMTVRPVDSAVTNPADDLLGMLMFMSWVLCYFWQVSPTMAKSVTVI